MKYTLQMHAETQCFASPSGTDVIHCSNKKEIVRHLDRWADELARFSEAHAEALVWKGHLNDVTDLYPEWIATLGPKGGLKLDIV